ncbi:MAG: hypothetical protein HQ555_09570 [Candidatus Aminicenantes bacterium]|nr:hypothetical protein [Candidatus Aminicenantes bacterium]
MEFILPTLKFITYMGIGMIVLGALVFLGIFKGSRSPLNFSNKKVLSKTPTLPPKSELVFRHTYSTPQFNRKQ